MNFPLSHTTERTAEEKLEDAGRDARMWRPKPDDPRPVQARHGRQKLRELTTVSVLHRL